MNEKSKDGLGKPVQNSTHYSTFMKLLKWFPLGKEVGLMSGVEVTEE